MCENMPEYFIPSGASRPRSIAIWSEVLSRLGMNEADGNEAAGD